MSNTTFADQRDAGMVHLAGSLVSALGIDTRKYMRTGIAKPGEGAYDWSAMRIDAMAEIERLIRERNAATAEAAAFRAERDEAQAEVRAMLEGRRDDEDRARMRLLEKVFAAEISSTGVPRTNLLPRVAALGMTQTLDTKDMRAALLADLDALVALGLRGEVV